MTVDAFIFITPVFLLRKEFSTIDSRPMVLAHAMLCSRIIKRSGQLVFLEIQTPERDLNP